MLLPSISPPRPRPPCWRTVNSGSRRSGTCPSGRGNVARIRRRWTGPSSSRGSPSSRRSEDPDHAAGGSGASSAGAAANTGSSAGSATGGTSAHLRHLGHASSSGASCGKEAARVSTGRESSAGSPRKRRLRLGSPRSGRLAVTVFVIDVARRAPRLLHVVTHDRDDRVIGHAALTRTVVIQDVTEPKPALLHEVPLSMPFLVGWMKGTRAPESSRLARGGRNRWRSGGQSLAD